MDVFSLGIYGKSHISGIFYLETINIGLVLIWILFKWDWSNCKGSTECCAKFFFFFNIIFLFGILFLISYNRNSIFFFNISCPLALRTINHKFFLKKFKIRVVLWNTHLAFCLFLLFSFFFCFPLSFGDTDKECQYKTALRWTSIICFPHSWKDLTLTRPWQCCKYSFGPTDGKW